MTSFIKVSEDQNSKSPNVASGRMTTDVSNKTSAEEGKDVLPKKPVLSDGVVHSNENGVKDVTQGQIPNAMDILEQEDKNDKEIKELPGPGSVEPMDLDGYSNVPEKIDSSCKRSEPDRLQSGRNSKERAPESRTPELSLEELSISSKHQQQAAKGIVQAVPTEEPVQRSSRKRKLLEDVESGKTLLLDAYRVWQQGQKVMAYDLGKIEKIMSETYMLIKQVKSFIINVVSLCDLKHEYRITIIAKPSNIKLALYLFKSWGDKYLPKNHSLDRTTTVKGWRKYYPPCFGTKFLKSVKSCNTNYVGFVHAKC